MWMLPFLWRGAGVVFPRDLVCQILRSAGLNPGPGMRIRSRIAEGPFLNCLCVPGAKQYEIKPCTLHLPDMLAGKVGIRASVLQCGGFFSW